MAETGGGSGRGQGQAVDRNPRDRPGVPMVPEDVVPVGPVSIPQQPRTVPVLVGAGVGGLTPVFSTAIPPRGLSGRMRRAAYRIPEHRARRWLLLLLADRVDVWEGRFERHPWFAVGLGVFGLGLLAVRLGRR